MSRALSVAERQKDNAAAAAAEATVSATKAKEVLAEMLTTINTEVANARRKSLQLQVEIIIHSQFTGWSFFAGLRTYLIPATVEGVYI